MIVWCLVTVVDYHCVVIIMIKCVKYWTKVLHMPNFRYLNHCYRMLKG